jgi:hypothetical protein
MQEVAMRHVSFVPIAGSTALALSFLGPALAYEVAVPPDEIIGRICTTKGGATFTFTSDGHYAYDGMWTDTGHYSARAGAVTILLDSGLERDFAISRRNGVLYMERTAVRCALPAVPDEVSHQEKGKAPLQ